MKPTSAPEDYLLQTSLPSPSPTLYSFTLPNHIRFNWNDTGEFLFSYPREASNFFAISLELLPSRICTADVSFTDTEKAGSRQSLVPLSARFTPRPVRIPGATVSGIELPIPVWVRREFLTGWLEHVPLTYLTDSYCRKASSDDVFSPPRPSNREELTLTPEEWRQGWSRLLSLIQLYLHDEHDAWITHFERIRDAVDLSTNWDLWIRYDIEVRRRSCHNPLDPAIFHSAIWSDLFKLVRFRARANSSPEIKKHQSLCDMQEARIRVRRQLEEVVLKTKKMKPPS